MTTQVQVTKEFGAVVIGPPAATAAVSKVVAYIIMVPGEDAGGSSNRQGHVYGRQVERIRQ